MPVYTLIIYTEMGKIFAKATELQYKKRKVFSLKQLMFLTSCPKKAFRTKVENCRHFPKKLVE